MADRYWVNDDSDGDWHGTNNWASTSGGTGGASVPGSTDDVIFDGNGVDDCTVSSNITVLSIDQQSAYTGTFKIQAYVAINGATTSIAGDVSIVGNYRVLMSQGTGTKISIASTGSITTTTTGWLAFAYGNSGSGGIEVASGGECGVKVDLARDSTVLSSSVFDGDLYLRASSASQTKEMPASVTVKGTLTIDGDSVVHTIDNDTNDTEWILEGDVVSVDAGSVVWDKGSGDITLSGSLDQDIDLDVGTVEEIIIDKTAGDVTLTGDLDTDGISYTANASTTSTFDADTFDVTLGTAGLDCTNGGDYSLDCGSGTWSCGGNWDVKDIGTYTGGTPGTLLLLTGTGTLTNDYNSRCQNVQISNDGFFDTSVWFGGTLTVDATRTLTCLGSATIGTLINNGTVTGDSGILYINAGITTLGTFAPNIVRFNAYNDTIIAGTYDCSFEIVKGWTAGDVTTTWPAGTVTIKGYLEISHNSGTATWTQDLATNDTNFVVEGDIYDEITAGGTVAWSKGDGSITLSGGEDQDIDLDFGTVEEIIIDKTAGDVTLTGDLDTVGISYTANAGTTSTFDADTYDVDIGTDGLVCTNGGDYTLDLGSGTWTCNGVWDARNAAILGTGASVDLAGTATCYMNPNGSGSTELLNLTISGSVTFPDAPYAQPRVSNLLNVTGTLTQNGGASSSRFCTLLGDANVTVQTGGVVTGTGEVRFGLSFNYNTVDNGITLQSGTWSVATTTFMPSLGEAVIAAGSYSGEVVIGTDNGTLAVAWTPASGAYSFEHFTVDAALVAINVTNSTNDPDMTFTGSVSLSAQAAWDKGSGDITLSGANDQDIDFNGETVEEIIIDKTAGDVTLTGDLDTDGISYNANAGTTSTFDAGTHDVTIGSSGLDGTNGADYTFTMGTGTWLANGLIDTQDIGTSTNLGITLDLNYTSTQHILKENSVDTVIYRNTGGDVGVRNKLVVATLWQVDAGANQFTYVNGGSFLECNVTIGDNANIDGHFGHNAPTFKRPNSKTFTIGTGVVFDTMFKLASKDAGTVTFPDNITHNGGIYLSSDYGTNYGASGLKYVMPSGTMTLSGNVYERSLWIYPTNNAGLDLEVDNDTNDTNYNLDADVVVDLSSAGTATLNYSKGTGTITLSGGEDQSIDFDGEAVEDIVINKTAGTVTMDGDVTTDSFTGTSTGTGVFDPNGQTISTVGNCDWASAFDMLTDADAFNGCDWDIGGDFTADGQDINATAAWYLAVAGTAVASGSGAVAYSDASGGTEITATAGPWTDDGNNTNWDFAASTGNAPTGIFYGPLCGPLAGPM